MVNRATARTWTDDELKSMPQAALKYLTICSKITVPPSKVASIFAGKSIQPGDIAAAIRISKTFGSKSDAHITPETYLNTAGGSFIYTPTVVEFTPITGEKQVRPNSVVPTRYDESERWENVQAVACLLSQFVQNKNNKWTSALSTTVYTKVWAKAEVGHEDLVIIVADTLDILNGDPVWQGLSPISKSAISGIRALTFVRAALDRCDELTYCLLNTRIVLHFLRPYEGSGDDWTRREKPDGSGMIPERAYQRYTPTRDTLEVLIDMGFPCAFMYKSGFIPMPSFPPNDGTLQSTQARHQRMVDVAGKGESTTMILAGMKGFSAITDDFGKKIQFLLSATLGCWRLGSPVDIHVSSTGDVPMIVSSLNHWSMILKSDKGWVDQAKVIGDFKILLPLVGDLPKVHSVFHSTIIWTPRHGSTIVSYAGGHLPTSGKKGTVMDYEYAARNLYHEPWQRNDIVVYTVIYGQACFNGNAGGAFSTTHVNTKDYAGWQPKTFVFEFGNSCHWRGILTTHKNFRMVGFGASNVGTVSAPVWDESTKSVVLLELNEAKTPSEWYKMVGDACVRAAFAFMAPVSRYSPISNLPFISKQGVTILAIQVAGENGDLIANSVRSARKPAIKSQVKLVLDERYNDTRSARYPNEGVIRKTTQQLHTTATASLTSPSGERKKLSLSEQIRPQAPPQEPKSDVPRPQRSKGLKQQEVIDLTPPSGDYPLDVDDDDTDSNSDDEPLGYNVFDDKIEDVTEDVNKV